ncbi:MAG: metalloregulator ArsR/SmtB family transcription factor [Myxococcales bacterium]|nr:metalloregulator ArsR/SmtB family transcription factor [Myxococcales bacterium]
MVLSMELPMETLERVAGALKVLAHPLRLKLAEILTQEELSVSVLAERTDAAQNLISQHLNMMKVHGLVTARRDARRVYYRAAAPEVFTIIACIHKHHGPTIPPEAAADSTPTDGGPIKA